MEQLNKCRLVMVADMAIQRFLKGVQTAQCGNNAARWIGYPTGQAPHCKIAVHTRGMDGDQRCDSLGRQGTFPMLPNGQPRMLLGVAAKAGDQFTVKDGRPR